MAGLASIVGLWALTGLVAMVEAIGAFHIEEGETSPAERLLALSACATVVGGWLLAREGALYDDDASHADLSPLSAHARAQFATVESNLARIAVLAERHPELSVGDLDRLRYQIAMQFLSVVQADEAVGLGERVSTPAIEALRRRRDQLVAERQRILERLRTAADDAEFVGHQLDLQPHLLALAHADDTAAVAVALVAERLAALRRALSDLAAL